MYKCLILFILHLVSSEKNEYNPEIHYITTEDGYILTYHRIPQCCEKPVALLMHGLFSSSSDFANYGRKKSLSFLLSSTGYDVWLGNARGNYFSRNHTKWDVNKDAQKFFDFSWHEIGYYDLPAGIDYILNITKQKSLLYVGFSQGGTSFLVMGSTKPQYNAKINLAVLLAPAGFREHENNILYRLVTPYLDPIAQFAENIGVFEVPFLTEIRHFLSFNCVKTNRFIRALCKSVYIWLGGFDSPQMDVEHLSKIFANLPSNSAIKQVWHYGQLTKNGGFSKYDYGFKKNMNLYGNAKPPAYNLTKINAPVSIYYGQADHLTNMKDIQLLIRRLPNVVNHYLVPYKFFGHQDFLYAKDVVDLVYNKLLKDINVYLNLNK